MNQAHKINLLAQLAQESEISDPIDWGYLSIDENTAYKMMAAHVIEAFDQKNNDDLVLLATITKLLVENFVLNLRLHGQDKTKSF